MLPSEYYYLTGQPIKLNNGLGKILQPKIIDFINNDITIEEFAHPFTARLESMTFETKVDEKILSALKDFDLFFIGENSMIDKLINSLKLLYNTNKVEVNKKLQLIIINNKITINRDNFTYLADIVLDMLFMEKPKKKEKEAKKFKDSYKQKLWEKLQMYRAKEEKKNEKTMADIVNIVVHLCNADYEKVCNIYGYGWKIW